MHALNNLKPYSTASDKVNQKAEALPETDGDDGGNTTAGDLAPRDGQSVQNSWPNRGHIPTCLCLIKPQGYI